MDKEVKKRNYFEIFLFVLLFFSVLALFIYLLSPANSSITGRVIPENQENQIVNINFVIEIKNAEHLNSDKSLISDVYKEIKDFDDEIVFIIKK